MEQHFCKYCLLPTEFKYSNKEDIDICYVYWYCAECDLTHKIDICCDDILYEEELDFSDWEIL